jgi:hypothetical protein
MLIPFGILSSAAGVEVGGDYELIASEILTASQASITFSNLGDYSSIYKHLQIRAVAKANGTGLTADWIRLRYNADTTSSYNSHYLFGTGSSVSSGVENFSNASMRMGQIPDEGPAGFGALVIDILDPFSTTKNTTARSLGGIASSYNYVSLASGAYFKTDSITSATLLCQTQNFIAGSRFSLYGIRG